MKVIFWGTPELAVPTLEAVAAKHDVLAVVCQPDRPKGRSGTPTPPPVKSWAQAHRIPVNQPTKLNDGTAEAWMKELAPDVCVLAAYGRLIKEPLLETPKHGFLNMHPSLLPKYRGPSPIQSALLQGDAETGVSIIRLSMEMDAGDILLQEHAPIGENENNLQLSDRLATLGANMMLTALGQVEAGTVLFTPQDHTQATHCSMMRKEDGRIRWADSAQNIHNLVRAAVPWPVAQCLYNGQVCRILQTEVVQEPTNAMPGAITQVAKDRIHIATGDHQLAMLQFQPPGKKAMPLSAYLLGQKITVGERFEDITDAS